MSMVKKSITVTDKQNEWMQSQLRSGEYASDSELLRDLIRKEQRRNEEIKVIREALITGEKSGYSTKSAEQILQEFKEKRRINV
ncbi:type II toxin-antitoxin system ParD family antitoxin [Aliiglaciecola sp. 3_MG-2023]|uniref:ribbon-helix-helix domain-containing protein n=1 Tax=Aliiglaciecola sp. 3_MG-2023 TaxID=3062644 RepID=UPI0026E35B23|nr:type II toxin-antitoxin system ParD family antitoxin [Aliiglaciecola sp. 3_MG-2023]MDO6694196.1 type II toxin-antitoxin system ParD family antitoxin [Aliiglaciecola sp. 3_MG-2023]